MRIAFVTARPPFPPLKGDQARAYHQIRLLRARHAITVITLMSSSSDEQDGLTPLRDICERVITVPLRRLDRAASLVRGAFTRLPLQTLLYWSPRANAAIHRALDQGDFDLIHVQLARMAPYLQNRLGTPRVIDLIDSLALNMERRYRREKNVRRYAAWLEWRRLSRYEREICQNFERATVVSATDKQSIGDYDNLSINPIGVDLSQFSYVPVGDQKRQPGLITFTGNMGYFPNIDAATWFASQVFPAVRARFPKSRFEIIGTNPAASIRQLQQSLPNVTVTGHVPNIAERLAAAQVAVVPMLSGSGMQFKVIEAMAVGTPVVATQFALGGLSNLRGDELAIENTAEGFAEQVCRLLSDNAVADSQSRKARAMVERVYSWEACVTDLEHVYQSALLAGRRGA